MDIQTLKKNLIEAYSSVNLNKIAVILLNLYKDRKFDSLHHIADLISESVPIEIDENGKGFSKLMLLYHPDRIEFHLNEIEKLAVSGDFDKLLGYSHILKLERLEEIASMLESMEDIDYSPVYAWDFDSEGFTINKVQYEQQESDKLIKHKNIMVSFYDAIKIRQYGHTKISFPNYYLEDIDEFELSDSGINDLDGIQYCIHAVNIDLSDNRITDLRPLEILELVESLNLSDNLISDIESLEYLTNLRELHLANNRIREIESLFSLANLEFVDLTGNPVPPGIIQKLKQQVAVVEY